MDDKYSPLLFADERSEAQQAALREQLDEDPELAKQWARWRRVRGRLRQRLQDQLPDRRLLVLYALEQEGGDEHLTPAERAALDAAREDIATAVDTIPALSRVIERIQDERAEFEEVWAQHQGAMKTDAPATEPSSEAAREDRPPRRPQSHDGTDRRWAWRLTVAALLVGAAVLAIVYGPQQADRTTVTVRDGEQRVVTFDDGSTARLVGAASLSYAPGTSTTEPQHVRLTRGRAYFDVVPRGEASFMVKTPAAQAEVLGTQFGVTTGSDSTEVVLVEGTVRVGAGDEENAQSVVLKPGERSVVWRGQAPSAPAPADLNAALEWSGLFVFRSTPTATIAERLGAHYGVSITVAPALADEPITGTFERDRTVSQVLTTIARTLGAEVRTEGGVYQLVPAS